MDYILWNKIKNIEHSTNWNKCGNRSKVRWEVLFPFSKELCLYLSILWHFVSIYKMFLMYLSLFCSFYPPTSTFPLSPNNLVYAFYWDLFYHLLIYQYICLPTYMCAHHIMLGRGQMMVFNQIQLNLQMAVSCHVVCVSWHLVLCNNSK